MLGRTIKPTAATDYAVGLPLSARLLDVDVDLCQLRRGRRRFGLGLSVEATIADFHGFDLRIEDNRPGADFENSRRQAN